MIGSGVEGTLDPCSLFSGVRVIPCSSRGSLSHAWGVLSLGGWVAVCGLSVIFFPSFDLFRRQTSRTCIYRIECFHLWQDRSAAEV